MIGTKDEYYSLKENIAKTGIHEKNANSIIKDAYDIIMELIRAKMMVDGFNASGSYAHEAEVSCATFSSFSICPSKYRSFMPI